MSKTTKLWINDKLELRHAINGWPKQPIKTDFFEYCHPSGNKTVYVGGDFGYDKAVEKYKASLAKAKAESILVLPPNDGRIVVGDRKLIPDTFIEIECEVEVAYQHKVIIGGGWNDCSEDHHRSQHQSFPHLFRQVARLVTQTKDVNYNALHDANDKDVASMAFSPSVITEGYRFSIVFSDGKLRASVPHGSCYHVKNISSESIDLLIRGPKGDIISLSPGDTKIFGEDLQQQLDAANARIKELESFVATIKARILEAYYHYDGSITMEELLDKLNIK